MFYLPLDNKGKNRKVQGDLNRKKAFEQLATEGGRVRGCEVFQGGRGMRMWRWLGTGRPPWPVMKESRKKVVI
jgi:hypothetical protein